MQRLIVAFVALFVFLGVAFISALYIQSERNANAPQPTPIFLPITRPSTLRVITGTVKITNVNTYRERIAQKGQEIAIDQGDRVETDTNTVATINFNDGTLVRLSSETTVLYGQKETILHFDQMSGFAYYRFKKTPGFRDGLEVETDSAFISTEGSAFGVFKYEGTKLVAMSEFVTVSQKNRQGVMIESSVTVGEIMQTQTVASGSAQPNSPLSIQSADLIDAEDAWFDFNQLADQLYDQGPLDNNDLRTLEELALGYITALPQQSLSN
jgi:hypothetical protein